VVIRLAKLTPLRAIRKKCLDCSNGSSQEVKLCPIEDCELYQYRMGKNPAYSGRKGNVESLRKWKSEQEVPAPSP